MYWALVLTIGFLGCQNEGAELTAPTDGRSDAPKFIELPSGMSALKNLSVWGQVTQKNGGELKLDYKENVEGKFELHVKLKFEKGTVSNDFDASLSMDANYLMNNVNLEFGPHGSYFIRPAKLEIVVRGMDLSGFTDNDKIYLYYEDSGQWTQMQGDVKISVNEGKLECKNGELPHFSRYAFCR
jgi:hypothetical protein